MKKHESRNAEIILFEKEDGKDTNGLIVEDTGKNPGSTGEKAGGKGK